MEIPKVYEQLVSKIPTLDMKKEASMKNYTTFKVGGVADILVKIKSKEELEKLVQFTKEQEIPLTILGNGSNLLVTEKGIRGIVAKIEINKLQIQDEMIQVGAGVKLGMLAKKLEQACLTGFEFAAGIPGTIGAAIRMNAGAYGGEFKDIVQNISYLNEIGEEKQITNQEAEFNYRSSRFTKTKDIIIGATLKLQKGKIEEIKQRTQEYQNARKEKQPVEYPSAGSTFKRGPDFISAKLIDECGLKGYKIGGAQVSKKHAGFIINKDNATSQDIIALIEYVKKVVKEKTGKELALEIEILGE